MFWGKGEWAKYKEWLTRQAFVDHDLSPTAKNAFVVVLWHINQDTLGWALKVGTIATALGKSDQLPAMGYDYDDVKRHEFGHCNGWPKDHAGMRSRPSPDPYKEAEEAWKKTPEGAQWEKEITRFRQLEEGNWRQREEENARAWEKRDEEARRAWERWQKSKQEPKK